MLCGRSNYREASGELAQGRKRSNSARSGGEHLVKEWKEPSNPGGLKPLCAGMRE